MHHYVVAFHAGRCQHTLSPHLWIKGGDIHLMLGNIRAHPATIAVRSELTCARLERDDGALNVLSQIVLNLKHQIANLGLAFSTPHFAVKRIGRFARLPQQNLVL